MRSLSGRIFTIATAASLVACGASSRPAPQAREADGSPPQAREADGPTQTPPVASTAGDETKRPVPPATDVEPQAPEAPSPPESEEAARTPFPPRPIAPPEPKTAQPNDGQWEPVPEAGSVGGKAVLYRTTLHPNPAQKWVYLVLVAIDLRRTELHLVAGTEEPANAAIAKEVRGGRVPLEAQPHLAAVFNGGFKASHGRYGMRLGPHLFVPPRPDACTIVLRAPSRVDIGTFDRLTIGDDESFRQTPPCLVEEGTLHPLLEGNKTTKKWGGAEDGRKDVRRTALAIDPSGDTLYFAFGDWITPNELGRTLQKAGVAAAAELDINWSFTRFLFFAPAEDGSGLEVSTTLVDQIEHRKKGYVQKSEPRDFFYLTRKAEK